ncbi:MAG: hypothetical protein DMG14_32770 [Acidobacteria bacterium]|nr:MAG: hypothetical protein DMG14_32770 [Acidobacteriota bacterium]
MTTVKIGLPDDQVVVLKAEAAAQGSSLENWFCIRSDQEVRPRNRRYTVAELIQQCDPNWKLSDDDRERAGSATV